MPLAHTFYAGFGASQPSFVGYIQDGKIFCSEAQGQQVIGVVSKTYDDLKSDYDSIFSRCQQYYDKLVELGEITPELTGDALIKEQSNQLARATELINQMAERQEHLLSVINSMTNNFGQTSGEGQNEYSSAHTETHSGDIAGMAANDKGRKQRARSIQKHQGRSVTGNSRTTA